MKQQRLLVRPGRVTLNPSVIVKILNEELFDIRPYMTGAESTAIEHDPKSEASHRLFKEKQLRIILLGSFTSFLADASDSDDTERT